MSEIKGIPDNIDDKLFTVKYKPDDKTHLVPDQECCKTCEGKDCTYVCPAHVYDWDADQNKLLVGYENCLECGACRIACSKQTLGWEYPRAGCGVSFKYG